MRLFHSTALRAAVVLTIIAAGCQQTNVPTRTPADSTAEVSATIAPVPTATLPAPTATPGYLIPFENLNDLVVVFSHPWQGELAATFETLVNQFNQTNEWGISVIVRQEGSSMLQADRVEKGPLDENYPQVVLAPSDELISWYEVNSRLRALNDFIEDPAYGLSEQQRVNYPLVFWQQDQAAGSQVGIPALRDTPVIYYNQTWAEELGFDAPPSTREAFREQACAAANYNNHDGFAINDGTGGWIVNTDGVAVFSWLKSFGFQNALTGDSGTFTFNVPETSQAFVFIRSMVDEGCAWFARTTSSNQYFANRQALMYAGYLSDLELQARTQSRLEKTDQWAILPFPGSENPVSVASGMSFGVVTGTPEQELASWLFIRWMSQPTNNLQILVKAGGLPVSTAITEAARSEMSTVQGWIETISWIPSMQSTPVSSGWGVAKIVLQDAFWQAMQSFSTVEDFPMILNQLDATIAEVLSQPNQ